MVYCVGDRYWVQEWEIDIVGGVNFGEFDLGLVNIDDFIEVLKEFVVFEGLIFVGFFQFIVFYVIFFFEVSVFDVFFNFVIVFFRCFFIKFF